MARIAPDIAARVPELANVVAFRNRLAHGYAAVVPDTVWRTAQEDLPVLKQRVGALLAELGENP
jgi:uncharacterized protein with HEPN domain